MATKTIFLTSGTSWVVPADCDPTVAASVTCLAAGHGGAKATTGGDGGGSGSLAISSVNLTPLATAFYAIGAGGLGATTVGDGGSGGDTWFNKSANSAPTLTTDGARANGPSTGNNSLGASSTTNVGTTKTSGGNAAAAVNPAGGNGGLAPGSSATDYTGGQTAGPGTVGTGGASGVAGGNAGNYGSGGGGGGANANGGNGAQGVIIVTYTQLPDSGLLPFFEVH